MALVLQLCADLFAQSRLRALNVEVIVMIVQLSAKQALWALSRAAEKVTSLAAGHMALMQELVAAMSLSNRWVSFECVLFAVCAASCFVLQRLHCSGGPVSMR